MAHRRASRPARTGSGAGGRIASGGRSDSPSGSSGSGSSSTATAGSRYPACVQTSCSARWGGTITRSAAASTPAEACTRALSGLFIDRQAGRQTGRRRACALRAAWGTAPPAAPTAPAARTLASRPRCASRRNGAPASEPTLRQPIRAAGCHLFIDRQPARHGPGTISQRRLHGPTARTPAAMCSSSSSSRALACACVPGRAGGRRPRSELHAPRETNRRQQQQQHTTTQTTQRAEVAAACVRRAQSRPPPRSPRAPGHFRPRTARVPSPGPVPERLTAEDTP